jgi:hypothetical protein
MSHKNVSSLLRFEIEQINQLLKTYHDLFEKSRKEEPDLLEVTAIASVLHSFYNGLENIFSTIAKNIDDRFPNGQFWHRDLLIQMSEENENRKSVLSNELKNTLSEYLGFRHFFRHAYSFTLEWSELKKPAFEIYDVWNQVKLSLERFLSILEANDATLD